jgi:lipoprotein-anchoring transpeptidase ErfK/SrfK
MPDGREPRPWSRTVAEVTITHKRRRLLACVAAFAAVALGCGACSSAPPGTGSASTSTTATPRTSVSTPASATSATSAKPTASTPRPLPGSGAPVHVSVNLSDGNQVGVGLPIIATFPVKITDARGFEAVTKVTVNGAPASGAWFFEFSDPASGHVMEAHYRLQTYWPAHARIHLDLPLDGLSAGPGLVFDDSLTLDFTTGAAHILTVDNATHRLTVRTDGTVWGTFPVSLGGPKSPTLRGVKVVMEKVPTVCMIDHEPDGTPYHRCGVQFDERLTYGGEYLHAAPWNVYNITHGINSSNGCTNLLPADAQKLYLFLGVGDVVQYPNADGPPMQLGLGFGDWNVPWSQWLTGGAVHTH